MDIIIQWIDVVWLLVALVIAQKNQRFWALGLVISGMLMLRLQAEFMNSIGYPDGMMGLIRLDVLYRGLCVYSLIYASYLLLIHYSRQMHGPFLMSASISAFFTGLFLSTFVMVL